MKQEITINDVKGIWIPLNEIHSLKELEVPVEPVKSKLEEARERYPAGTKVKCLFSYTLKTIIEKGENDLRLSTWLDAENGVTCKVYDGEKDRWAEIVKEETFPTMDEIYDSVKPEYFATTEGLIADVEYEKGQHNDYDLLPTYEDTAHSIAYRTLVVIATYYNAMFPDEKKDRFLVYNTENNNFGDIEDHFYNKCGQINFTPSSAKEALKNPNVVDVLNKYFRISK